MKKTLVNYYLLVTLLFSAFVIISLTALYVKTQHDIFIQNSQEIHTKVLDNYKRELKNRVELIEQQIQYKKASTEVRPKESIKSRVYEAHAIAESIYANNVGKIDDSAIQKLIVETLRNIRFNQGRGYYFIDTLEGDCVLFPTRSSEEGKNILHYQDIKGKEVVKGIITIKRRV